MCSWNERLLLLHGAGLDRVALQNLSRVFVQKTSPVLFLVGQGFLPSGEEWLAQMSASLSRMCTGTSYEESSSVEA